MKYIAESDPFMGEYFILYCLLKSFNDSTGVSSLETVKKAAKFAVYDAMMMNPKSHHVAAQKKTPIISFWNLKKHS